METIIFKLKDENLTITGETMCGVFSTGKCNIYSVESESAKWSIDLAITSWENGEEEVTAKNVSPPRLNLIKNRLRMVVSKCELPEYPNSKFVTLRVAFIKNEATSEWSNLKNASLGELSDMVGGNIVNYFKKIGASTVDYKIDIFSQTGTSANQLVAIYPEDNVQVPIHAFVITRVLPFFIEE